MRAPGRFLGQPERRCGRGCRCRGPKAHSERCRGMSEGVEHCVDADAPLGQACSPQACGESAWERGPDEAAACLATASPAAAFAAWSGVASTYYSCKGAPDELVVTGPSACQPVGSAMADVRTLACIPPGAAPLPAMPLNDSAVASIRLAGGEVGAHCLARLPLSAASRRRASRSAAPARQGQRSRGARSALSRREARGRCSANARRPRRPRRATRAACASGKPCRATSDRRSYGTGPTVRSRTGLARLRSAADAAAACRSRGRKSAGSGAPRTLASHRASRRTHAGPSEGTACAQISERWRRHGRVSRGERLRRTWRAAGVPSLPILSGRLAA